jgi:glycosyltransferase involved in cell wall biosynthesis
MRILIATGIFPPDIGGPATYSKLLRDELPKRGIEVKILNFGEVRRLPKLIRHFVYFWRVLRKGRNVNIIFAQDPVSVGLPSIIAAKILRKKFVLKIVGDYAWEQGMQRFGIKDLLDDFANKKYGRRVEFLRKIQRFVAKNADLIITPSEYLKKIIIKWGINSGKITVIHNAFDAPEIKISKSEARKKLNLSGMILISAGRLVPWKGFGALIDIMPDIIAQIPDAKLIIIGSGPEEENLKFKIENLKLENSVISTGQIPHRDLISYLRAGDIFILNTGYEGFSHQILEAMMAGIPVIATRVGGNRELIDDGKNGILVEYNDKRGLENAVLNLYDNKEVRDRLIRQAEEDVKKFSPEIMLDKLSAILEN